MNPTDDHNMNDTDAKIPITTKLLKLKKKLAAFSFLSAIQKEVSALDGAVSEMEEIEALVAEVVDGLVAQKTESATVVQPPG